MIQLTLDLLKKSVDWINVVPNGCSFNELLEYFEKYDILYTKRFQFNNYFVVVDSRDYSKFIDCFNLKMLPCRITRIDIKFDFAESYFDMYEKYSKFLMPSSSISNNDIINTCYFGNRESGIYARFYNKTYESNLPDNLSRLEYEIKSSIALQFSERWLQRDFDDASNYLSKWLSEFNNVYGLDVLIGSFNFNTVAPFDLSYFLKNDLEASLQHFLKQYSKSVIKYTKYLGSYDALYRLCLEYGK